MDPKTFLSGLQDSTTFGIDDLSELKAIIAYLEPQQQEMVEDYFVNFMPNEISSEFNHWSDQCLFTPELLSQFILEYDEEEEPLCNFREFPFFRIGSIQSNHGIAIDLRTGQFVDIDESLYYSEDPDEWDDYIENRGDTLEEFVSQLVEDFFGEELPYA